MTKNKIPGLISVWFVANFVPHIFVFLATGKIYYQLPTVWMIVAETSIMVLNLLLPVVALHYLFHQDNTIRANLGWQWTGWRIVGIGLLGCLLSFAIALATQQNIGDPLSPPSVRTTSFAQVILLLLLLFVLTALAEETMFRGWIQTTLTQEYGVWVGMGVTAVLFGLRHLPMDLYVGLSQNAPLSAWVSRMLQLNTGAILFGVARNWARSTWASWIMHEGALILIVVVSVIAASR